ncbi:MAG: hypothetical protein UT84_C0009G0014 [Candidatus Curtissbacteria bacterium GW2011_GWA1_40_16]|uniref:Uncharacterized protein n=1 Tax=Candidatus Curtissbacteria bacterium GW2011_GWA1_40_16 TaxID=1618405 RepID=A0A0G0UK64_9BACT|nr:MAG: hypothetical protein UT84_C0009G0014 [Candidatus Curtissbacteria bacterium GW2011_GWA1_40_16]
MNLSHRLADSKKLTGLEIVMHKIRYPLNIAIPLIIFILTAWGKWTYFGNVWEVGVFSTQFVPWICGIFAQILNIDPQILISDFILVLMTLGPVSFYFFAQKLTHRHFPAVITGLATMLPVFWFSSNLNPRLILALRDGDGGHIAGLTVITMASLIYLLYVREGKKLHLFLLTILLCLAGLISFFSLYIFMAFFILISISEILVGYGKIKAKRFAMGGILIFLIIAVVYNLDLWNIVSSEDGRTALVVMTNIIPLLFFLVPVLGTISFLIFDRRPELQPLFLALGTTAIFGLLHFVRVSIVDIPLLHQDRYAAEFSFSTGFLIGVITTYIFDLLRAGKLINKSPLLYNRRTLIAFVFAGIILLGLLGSVLFIPRSFD